MILTAASSWIKLTNLIKASDEFGYDIKDNEAIRLAEQLVEIGNELSELLYNPHLPPTGE